MPPCTVKQKRILFGLHFIPDFLSFYYASLSNRFSHEIRTGSAGRISYLCTGLDRRRIQFYNSTYACLADPENSGAAPTLASIKPVEIVVGTKALTVTERSMRFDAPCIYLPPFSFARAPDTGFSYFPADQSMQDCVPAGRPINHDVVYSICDRSP